MGPRGGGDPGHSRAFGRSCRNGVLMKTRLLHRALTIGIATALGVMTLGTTSAPAWTDDPAQVVPLDAIAPESREAVAEVIRETPFHHRGDPETSPCHSRVYLSLLNEPGITLALWKDLSPSAVQLQQVGANRYQGSDGNGAT